MTQAALPARRTAQRLFFALWPDAGLRGRIALATTQLEANQRMGGRPLPPGRYHLTLRFLGGFDAIAPSRVEAAIAAADEVRVAGFELSLDRAGTFGGTRVGWLGPSGGPPGLQALWLALGLALDRHGVPHENPPASGWTPHVTVLRGLRRPLPPALGIPSLPWTADGFVLVRSEPGDAAYQVVQRWRLDDGERT